MPLLLITPAAAPAITLAEAKLHLRVTHAEEDTLITSMVAAATAEAEHLMQRAIMRQTWRLSLDAWPSPSGAVELRRPPVASITSVRCADASTGEMTTLVDAYRLVQHSEHMSLVLPAFGATWPATATGPGAVEVTFLCGYATAADVPAPIKHWILLRLGGLYEHREAWTSGQAIERNEHVDRLLDRYSLPTL